MILWFFTTFGGTFPRLLTLFSKDWAMAPKFLEEFLTLLPISLRNGVEFTTANFVDAVLRTVAPINFDIAVPLMDVDCVPLVKENMHIPVNSIQLLIRWTFSTKTCRVDVKESVTMMIHDQYPGVIVYHDVIDYCAVAGF